MYRLSLLQKKRSEDEDDLIGKQDEKQDRENMIEKTGHSSDPPFDHMVPGNAIKITGAAPLRIYEVLMSGNDRYAFG